MANLQPTSVRSTPIPALIPAQLCPTHGPISLDEAGRASQLVRQYRLSATPCLQCVVDALEGRDRIR